MEIDNSTAPTSTLDLSQINGTDAQPQTGVQAQMCACLLDASLPTAHLPPSAESNLRERFGGKIFEPGALQQAISETRTLISDLTGGSVIQGAARISDIVPPEDQVNAALCDLLGASRPQGLEGLHPARLSGIRELYTLMTGDTGFTGGYHRERAQFAATSNLPGLLKNAMNKVILDQWQELGRSGYRWWEPVVQVEHFNSLQEITGVLVGEVTVLPSVSEGAAYTELAVKDSAETGAWGKYGGYVGLTLEMFERDETHKLRQYPRKLTPPPCAAFPPWWERSSPPTAVSVPSCQIPITSSRARTTPTSVPPPSPPLHGKPPVRSSSTSLWLSPVAAARPNRRWMPVTCSSRVNCVSRA